MHLASETLRPLQQELVRILRCVYEVLTSATWISPPSIRRTCATTSSRKWQEWLSSTVAGRAAMLCQENLRRGAVMLGQGCWRTSRPKPATAVQTACVLGGFQGSLGVATAHTAAVLKSKESFCTMEADEHRNLKSPR